jgi:dynactin complex subunit
MEFQYFNEKTIPIKKYETERESISYTYPNDGDIRFPKFTKSYNDSECYINRRIEVQDYIATVKYCGKLLHKQDKDIWIGVVWDEKTRGKHNGKVEDKEYFICENNSGSLLKFSKVNHGIGFIEAVSFKYKFFEQDSEEYKFLSEALDRNMFIEAKRKIIKIEFIGKEKAIKKFAEIEKIQSV